MIKSALVVCCILYNLKNGACLNAFLEILNILCNA